MFDFIGLLLSSDVYLGAGEQALIIRQRKIVNKNLKTIEFFIKIQYD